MSAIFSSATGTTVSQCPSPDEDYSKLNHAAFAKINPAKQSLDKLQKNTITDTQVLMGASPPDTRSNSVQSSPLAQPAKVDTPSPSKPQQRQPGDQRRRQHGGSKKNARGSRQRTAHGKARTASNPTTEADLKSKDKGQPQGKDCAAGSGKQNSHRRYDHGDRRRENNGDRQRSHNQHKQRRSHGQRSNSSNRPKTDIRDVRSKELSPALSSAASDFGNDSTQSGDNRGRSILQGSDEDISSAIGHIDDTDESDEEYDIGFSQEVWKREVLGHEVLPTGLEKTLTMQILHTYETRLFPSAESIEIKRAFIEKFATILSVEFPEWEVDIHVFGSSVNGLGTSRSDVDICLTTEHRELENVFVLNKALRKYNMRTYCVPHARVPIVKAWDPELRIASDINVNNTIALHNTRMIQTFVAIDARVRPFVMAIKHWTKCREINDAAFGGTLSPYAWVNLAVQFLQTRSPPILPVLHSEQPSMMNGDDGFSSGQVDLTFNDNIELLRGFGAANKESLGFLLYSFFRTYAYEFDYLHQVVSLRRGCYLTKEQKGWDKGRPSRIFCIEEPFSTWLNLGHSANTISVEGIRHEFQRSFAILRGGGSYDEVCEVYQRPQRPIHYISKKFGANGSTDKEYDTQGYNNTHCNSSHRGYLSNSSTGSRKTHMRSVSNISQSRQGKRSHGNIPLPQTKSPISSASSLHNMDPSIGSPVTITTNNITVAAPIRTSSSYSPGYQVSPYGVYHSTNMAVSSPYLIHNSSQRESDDIFAPSSGGGNVQQSRRLYSTRNQLHMLGQHQVSLDNTLAMRFIPTPSAMQQQSQIHQRHSVLYPSTTDSIYNIPHNQNRHKSRNQDNRHSLPAKLENMSLGSSQHSHTSKTSWL